MISSEAKIIIGVGAVVLGVCGICMYGKERSDIRSYEEEDKKREHQLKLKEVESKLPPEYWNAKAVEHEASVKKHEMDVAKDERLTIDKRNREDAELAAKREFEKNAPAEYWEQKRIEEQEKTKREADRQRYAAEQEAARQHRKAVEETARIAEKTIKQQLGGYSTGYALL